MSASSSYLKRALESRPRPRPNVGSLLERFHYLCRERAEALTLRVVSLAAILRIPACAASESQRKKCVQCVNVVYHEKP